MNERIQAIAEQAAELCQPEFESESLRQRRLYNEIFLPKFAELIVRECMSNLYLHGYDDARAQIKQHFGVAA